MLKFILFISSMVLSYGAQAQMSLHPLTFPPQGRLILVDRDSSPNEPCRSAVTLSFVNRSPDHYELIVDDAKVPRETCAMFAVITTRHYIMPKNKISWGGTQSNAPVNYAVYHGTSTFASFAIHANGQAKFSDLRIYPNSPFLAQFVEVMRTPNGQAFQKVYVLPKR